MPAPRARAAVASVGSSAVLTASWLRRAAGLPPARVHDARACREARPVRCGILVVSRAQPGAVRCRSSTRVTSPHECDRAPRGRAARPPPRAAAVRERRTGSPDRPPAPGGRPRRARDPRHPARPRRQGLPRQPQGQRAQGLQPQRHRGHQRLRPVGRQAVLPALSDGARNSLSDLQVADQPAAPGRRGRRQAREGLRRPRRHERGPAQPRARAQPARRGPGEDRRPDPAPRSAAGRPREPAINDIAGEMQAFLASDVVYSQRVGAAHQGRRSTRTTSAGQQIAAAASCRTSRWLAPATVGRAPGPQREQRPTGTRPAGARPARPRARERERRRRHAAARGARRRQPRPAVDNPTFTVKFANQGDNDETNVKVTVAVSRRPASRSRRRRPSTRRRPSQTATVDIPLGAAPPATRPTTVTVAIAKVPGEKTIDNNRTSYTVIFTR